MTAVIVAFPHRYDGESSDGPTGPLIDAIQDEERRLKELMDGFPFGSQFDSRAGVDKDTTDELPFAVHMLREANNIIERASKREAKYSLDNGWPAPRD